MAIYESYLHYAASLMSEWEQLRDEGREGELVPVLIESAEDGLLYGCTKEGEA